MRIDVKGFVFHFNMYICKKHSGIYVLRTLQLWGKQAGIDGVNKLYN